MGHVSLKPRVDRLERLRPPATPVLAIHGAAGPDGRCLDCDLDAGAHFTITIDSASGVLERRYIGLDLEAV